MGTQYTKVEDVCWSYSRSNNECTRISSAPKISSHATESFQHRAEAIIFYINIFLQVRVGFGGIWKDSLGELSGGQRSLVALSLILAMLLFKPAPIYILDEVDAALDLSHTQNIGNMLKTHFKHSQVRNYDFKAVLQNII
jgi:ABC-type Mn2+/Zn2+ transport system ATPase subunit